MNIEAERDTTLDDSQRIFREKIARRFYEKNQFRVVRLGLSPPPENEPDVEYRWRPA